MNMKLPKLTFWRTVFVLILISGAFATYIRIFGGLGASTNLSDEFPWGIWIGFDILCGVMLAAGGFTLMATVHIFNVKEYKPIARPALLTAFLGYLLVIGALMFDLGQPWNVFRVMVTFQPRSVMWEVGWCVMLYTTVLFLEFLPIVFEKLRYEKPLRILHMISVPLIILGVILSTLHQSSLGSLYLIVPGKLHPLWYTPMLPVLFWISAITIGLAMTIFESTMSARHFPGHSLEPRLIRGLGGIMMVFLIIYGVVRMQNLFSRDALQYAMQPTYEATMFWAEVALGFAIPIALLMFRQIRESPVRLYIVSILVISGFLLNRLNVAVTGMEGSAGVRYIPKWSEVSITLSIVAVGIFLFTMAVKYLPIFTHGHEMPAEEKSQDKLTPTIPVPVG
ncbi:MAG TPA: Ni/Fe-hydrogenase cytochrome b subunit [Thermoanaerobaculia bacterium]